MRVIRKKIEIRIRPKKALVRLKTSTSQYECLACGAFGAMLHSWPLGCVASNTSLDDSFLKHKKKCAMVPAAEAAHRKNANKLDRVK